MPSYSEQVEAALFTHRAVDLIEETARLEIEQTLDEWDAGLLNARTVRYRLERIARDSYRSSVALAVAHTGTQTGIPGWKPRDRVFVTPYLTALISDIRRNLREFKAAGRTEEARRRASLRMRHSVGVAAQRGYTDAIVRASEEMLEFGMTLRKVWVANLRDGHVPCPDCIRLHGTEVGLTEEFPLGGSRVPYIDLLGPPAHPQCQCVLVVLTVTLENALETLDVGTAKQAPESMKASEVRKMPAALFLGFIGFLGKVAAKIAKKALDTAKEALA